MCPLRYYSMLRRSKDPIYLRFELVRYAREHGVKPAARQFGTTVKTVRKWLRRWEPDSLRGLEDRSRAPLHPRRGVTATQRRRAVALKRRLPSWGASRMKRDYGLSLSEKALRHIWREEGLRRRKRRKHKTKQCLRDVKRQWRLFEQTSVDTKDLCDIPELWAQAQRLGLPRYQYTAREVTSGWHYVACAQECTLAYSKLFAEVILSHLKSCGVKFRGSRLQTDNGCEFVGNWQARSDSQFTVAVEAVKGLRHTRCPPRAHTWQSDVETAHRLIEDEFYEVERFRSRSDFIAKAGAYNLWFNVARRNSGKEHKTPWELIHEKEPRIDPAICALEPVFLDELFMRKLDAKLQWGYDVIPHPWWYTADPMTPPAGDNPESAPWRGIGRLLCAAGLLHLVLSVTLYEVGRRAALPGAIDQNGIVMVVMSDAPDVRDDAAELSGALRAGEVRDWLGADHPFHVKLYALCFALFGPWLGYNLLAAEPLNAFLYLASLAAAFGIGKEVFNRRAGLLAAGAVALWPSFLLHSTQLLKDPLFVPGFLALVLILVRLLTRTYSWAGALQTFAAGALIVTALWLTRRNWGWLLIATVFVGALVLAVRQLREGRALAANLVCAALLLAAVVCVPLVMPNALKLGATRGLGKAASAGRLTRPREPVAEGSRQGYIWSRAAAQVGEIRRGLARAFPDSGSDIDAEVQIGDASDLLRYLPRAATVGFFAPFPNMWLTSGKQVGATGRRLAGLESLAMYAVEALALVGWWRGRRLLPVWLLASLAAVGMTALGLVLVNVGALYRMRYGFLALLIIVAAGATAGLLDRQPDGSPVGGDRDGVA